MNIQAIYNTHPDVVSTVEDKCFDADGDVVHIDQAKVDIEIKRMEKAQKIEDANSVALAYLDSTDWYIIREMDSGVPTPQAIKDAREAARSAIKEL